MRKNLRDQLGIVHRVKSTNTVTVGSDEFRKRYHFIVGSDGRTAVTRSGSYLVVCEKWVRPSKKNWDNHPVTCLLCLAGGP